METQPQLFDCPRHQSLKLSALLCAGMWRKAKALPIKSYETVTKCRGCEIGACHAGQKVEASRAAVVSDHHCARCGNPRLKLIQGNICVSCYNRQLEVQRGVNRRGTKPQKAKPGHEYYAIAIADKARPVRLPLVAHGTEAELTIMRQSTEQQCLVADHYAALVGR